MKNISLILTKVFSILFIFLFILIPNVKAGVINEEHNDYFFFLEPLSPDNDIVKGEETSSTTNTTTFPIAIGGTANETTTTQIELARTCSNQKSDNCWNYDKFYSYWNKIAKSGNHLKYEYGGQELKSKCFSEGNTKKYYAHSSHCSGGTSCKGNYIDNGVWNCIYSEQGCIEDESSKETYATSKYPLICSSFNTEASIKYYDTDITGLEVSITRKNETKVNISDKTNARNVIPSTNCNDGEKIVPFERLNEKNKLVNTVLSPVLFRNTYVISKYYCDEVKNSIPAKCNETTNMESDCEMLTITTSTSLADVTIDQTATIANILTPTTIYQGGGIKFGFVYYNTIKWSYADGGRKLGDYKNEVPDIMYSKLKGNENDFASQINVSLNFNGTLIDNSLIQKKCTRTGNFNEGETVTTICTIFLPNSSVELGTGKVEYNNSKYPNYGINNQYYTPLSYTGDYKVSATLSGLNALKSNKDDGIEDWTMTFDDDDSCTVNVYNRLYEKDSTNYKFIYRPISINNPFPDRNAGVNWYEWYSKDSNKKRLQESYSKLQYQVALDNQTVAKIKDYNTNHNYLEWDNIENGESDFIDTYFFTKRENLGDGS